MRGSSGQSPYWMLLGSIYHQEETLMTHLALRQAARMTLMLASYLSKFVAETLRASQTSQGAPLIRKTYIFLRQITGFNPFIKSCCMRLLGTMPVWKEKGSDPAVGWSKLWLRQRRAKIRAPAVDTACVSDWIGGFCPADSLMIWFPAQVIQELERREQDHRQGSFQWHDEQIPDKYRKQYQDARDSRTLHFQKTPISQEPYPAPYCFNTCWLVFLAGSKLCGSNAETYDRASSGGSFRQKHPRRGRVTSQSVSKSPCACPTKEILIHGTRILPTLIPTTSRRLLPINFLPFAPRWGCLTWWGEIFTPMAPATPSSMESWPWLPCRTPWGTAYPQPALPARGRCQGLSITPFILATMVELGKYQKGVTKIWPPKQEWCGS